MKIYEESMQQMMEVPGEKGSAVAEKCKRVVSANKDLKQLKTICDILKDENAVTKMSPATLACSMYAPITSVEVERSFSIMKNILSDRRLSMNV